MRNRIFHQARIAGLTFDGIIAGDEPYLSCQINGGVALGVCTLRYFQPEAWGSRLIPPLGLVVKYHNEERIFLAGFDAEAEDVAYLLVDDRLGQAEFRYLAADHAAAS